MSKDNYDEMLQRIKNSCTHLDASGAWNIGLQHNFPDGAPRGICMRCHTVIHPAQWESSSPNRFRHAAAHPLYPVVIAIEKRDHARAVLDDVYTAAINILLCSEDRRLMGTVYLIYAQAYREVDHELITSTETWRNK